MATVQLKNQTNNLKVEQRSPNVKISKKQNTVKIAQKAPKIKLTKKSTNLHIKQGQSNLTIKRIKIPNIVLKQEGRGAPGPDGADGADGEYPLVVQPGTPNIEDQDKIWLDTDDFLALQFFIIQPDTPDAIDEDKLWIDTDELLDINLPPGGTTGQVLKKNTNDSYDASWQNESSGGGGSGDWGDINGTLSDQTDLQAALDDKRV